MANHIGNHVVNGHFLASVTDAYKANIDALVRPLLEDDFELLRVDDVFSLREQLSLINYLLDPKRHRVGEIHYGENDKLFFRIGNKGQPVGTDYGQSANVPIDRFRDLYSPRVIKFLVENMHGAVKVPVQEVANGKRSKLFLPTTHTFKYSSIKLEPDYVPAILEEKLQELRLAIIEAIGSRKLSIPDRANIFAEQFDTWLEASALQALGR